MFRKVQVFVCFMFWAGGRPLPTGSPQNLSSNRQKLEGLWGARLKGERGFCPPISMQCAVPISLAPTPRSVESTDTCGRGDDFAFQHWDWVMACQAYYPLPRALAKNRLRIIAPGIPFAYRSLVLQRTSLRQASVKEKEVRRINLVAYHPIIIPRSPKRLSPRGGT